MNNVTIEVLQKNLEKEKAERKKAETILEQKSRNLLLISRELKLANQKLTRLLDEKSSQLQAVFENLNDAYLEMDLFGNIFKMNDIARDLFNFYDTKNTLNINNVIFNEDKDYINESFKIFKKTGTISNIIFRIITPNNELKWVQINASLVRDKSKRTINAQGIVRDITNIKKLEIEQENYLTELGRHNQELNEYAHMVSHDLKSPLQSLDALTTWITEDYSDKLGKGGLDIIKLIRENVEKMDTLINGILEYSTIGKREKESYEVNLEALVTNIIDTVDNPNNIEILIENELPNIQGDKYRLELLFNHLIENAIKFNDKNEKGFIQIKCESKGAHWQFSITDNGKGIEDQYLEKIFIAFQKLENDYKAIGIGLSIVKKIVEAYKGNIWVDSKLNEQTTFFFTLKK